MHLLTGGFAISVLEQTAVKCPQLAHKEYLQHMSDAPQDAPPSSYLALLPNLVQVSRALYPVDKGPRFYIRRVMPWQQTRRAFSLSFFGTAIVGTIHILFERSWSSTHERTRYTWIEAEGFIAPRDVLEKNASDLSCASQEQFRIEVLDMSRAAAAKLAEILSRQKDLQV